MSEIDAWSTVRVALPDVSIEPEAMLEATDRVEALAALLAELDEIGGVEVRDPSCITDGPEFVAVERPELIAYTTPAGREVVVAQAAVLAQQLGLRVTIEAADHVGDEWRDAWKRYYRPLRFGADAVHLLIRPSWIAREPDDPATELILDPGRAFGTGLHESTRLCLRALVGFASRTSAPPRRAIDLGCGSGILGLAAAKLFPHLTEPGALLLADYDPEATETAQENAEINGMTTLAFATVRLEHAVLPPVLVEFGPAQLVFANIRPSVLIPNAPAITACVAPGGLLVLSGILDEEADSVRAAYPTLVDVERIREADWCAVVLRRSE